MFLSLNMSRLSNGKLDLVLSTKTEESENPSEIRKDYRSGYLVVISRLRSKQYISSITTEEYKNNSTAFDKSLDLESRLAKCAFEPGKEDLNKEVVRVGSPWEIRVIENKFPSLSKNANVSRWRGENGLFELIGGHGYNEVVIDSPNHEELLEGMNTNQLTQWLDMLIDREEELYKRDNVKYVQIYRNYGIKAGASIEHPHTQVMAWPILAGTVAKEVKSSKRYLKKHSTCLYEDALKKEVENGRILTENSTFIAVAPFASRFAGESMILPKRHLSYLGGTEKGERKDLVEILKSVLKTNKELFGDISYNFSFHDYKYNPDLHMHLEIYPRILNLAGVELGQNIFVNTMSPEDYAKEFRAKQECSKR